MRSLIRIVLGILYQPRDLLSFLDQRRRNVWLALSIGLCVAVGSTVLSLISMSILVAELPIEMVGLAIMLPLLSLMLSGFGVMQTPQPSQQRRFVGLIFWFSLTQTTITPFLLLGFSLLIIWTLPYGGLLTPTQGILALLWVGIAVGRICNVVLVLHRSSKHMLDRRWLVVIGGPLLAIFILLIPQANSAFGDTVGFMILGAAIAQFRLGAWLWQSLWALALVSTTTFTRRPDRIGTYLPAAFDQLRFLPLPGTTALLRRQSRVCAYQTRSWIIQLAAYPNDRSLATRFIVNMPQEPQAYATLFWLSVDPAGQAILQSLTKPHQRAPALVHAYAQLSQVVAPGAWRVALEHAARTLIAAPPPTDILWLPLFIATAQMLLEARSWERVQQGMLGLGESVHGASPTIEDTLIALGEQIHQTLRDHVATDLHETWPIRLLAAATEQLTFLKSMA